MNRTLRRHMDAQIAREVEAAHAPLHPAELLALVEALPDHRRLGLVASLTDESAFALLNALAHQAEAEQAQRQQAA